MMTGQVTLTATEFCGRYGKNTEGVDYKVAVAGRPGYGVAEMIFVPARATLPYERCLSLDEHISGENPLLAYLHRFYPNGAHLSMNERDEYLNRGVGNKVYTHCLNDAKKRGAKAMVAIGISDDMMKFLEKKGFTQFGPGLRAYYAWLVK